MLDAPNASAPRASRYAFAWAAVVLAALAWLPSMARAAEPDYSGWQALLKRYVRVVQTKGQPWDSRFDYAQLYVDEGIWTKHRADSLALIHTELLSVSPGDMKPHERTAWAINTYNFLVIERMTVNLLVPRRQFMRFDSPKQVNTDAGLFFVAPVATIEGREYSLGGFERRFVYGDTSADPLVDGMLAREKPGDPRIAFALCKASYCTGPLVPWAYRADSLDAQLDRAARIALALPTYLKPDPVAGTLTATNMFFEARADFGGPELPELMPFLLKHAPLAVRRLIVAKKLARPTMFFEPSWKLNQWDMPKPKLPNAVSADSSKAGGKH